MDGRFVFTFMVIATYVNFVSCFNVDLENAVLKETSNSDFYFGYSVAQHSVTDDPDASGRYWVLVGAPHANSSNPLLNTHSQTGALYKCQIDVSQPQSNTGGCVELPYPDTTDLNKDIESNLVEDKKNMWLGVNIRSAGAGKPIAACGHRYKAVEPRTNVYGLGVCYFYKNDMTLNTQKPANIPCTGQDLVDAKSSITGRFGLCAAGMGLDAADKDVVYGVPGASIWKGTVKWDRDREFPDSPISYMVEPTPSSGPNTVSYALLGSSVVIGSNLLDNDRKKVTMVGAPREPDGGAVIVYELDQSESMLKERSRYSGDQFGAGFGHSVALIDISMDSHPSLVVGAPYYRSQLGKDSNSRRAIGGAVYVYYNYGIGLVPTTKMIITPGACQSGMSVLSCNNAQFGYSVTNTGDINGDGFEDLAVGAPFYDRGAVFIYNGLEDGTLSPQHTQVIMASDVASSVLKRSLDGFGISLSGGNNMDEQGYTDLLVGAHTSSHTVLLRSRPVITIKGSIQLISGDIDTLNTSCASDPTSPVSCIDFETCFEASFSGNPGTSASDRVTIGYTLVGDSGYEFPSNRRVTFNRNFDVKKTLESSKTKDVELAVNGVEVCERQTVYIAEMRDVLKAVKFSMKYELQIPPAASRYSNINTYPIMDAFAPTMATVSVDFQRKCKTKNCNTDLGIAAVFTDMANIIPVVDDDSNEAFVFDSNKVDKLELLVKLSVDHTKDRAYEPLLYVFLQPQLTYVGQAAGTDPSASCTRVPGQNAVICSFGRDVEPGDERKVVLTLDYENLGPSFSTINITANTTSDDNVEDNNFASLKVKVNVITDLELLGSVSRGGNVKYGGGEIKGASAMSREDEVGDLVQHTYTVINSGEHGTVSMVHLVIQWPYEIASDGKYLLYMTTDPTWDIVDAQGGHCKVADDDKYINPNNLELVDEESNEDEEVTIRYKRDVKQTAAVKTFTTNDGSSRTVADLNCYDGTATCFNITCQFYKLQPGALIKVRATSRLWNSSLAKGYHSGIDAVLIRSSGYLTIDPSSKVSQTDTKNDRVNVTTEAIPDITLVSEDKKVAIWIWIVAAVVGIVLLLIIILVCWKCGFFKRNKPPTFAVKVEKQKKEGTTYNQVPQTDPDAAMYGMDKKN